MIDEVIGYIIPILAMLESAGDPNAVNGDAVGILQIRPIMVDEVNRIIKLNGSLAVMVLNDRLDPATSAIACDKYLRYWLPRKSINFLAAPAAQRQEKVVETAARLWLGGSSKGFDSVKAKEHGYKAAYIFRLLKQTKKLGTIADMLGMDTEAFCFSAKHELEIAKP